MNDFFDQYSINQLVSDIQFIQKQLSLTGVVNIIACNATISSNNCFTILIRLKYIYVL